MLGANVAVFVDGCFWHGCPVHYSLPASNSTFWNEKLLKNRSRDEAATRNLEMQGWKVLRFWEHELTEDIDSVISRIRAAMGR
jgi:DNA mismatch endonuclease (patch repair protein)